MATKSNHKEDIKSASAVFKTSLGDFIVELFVDKAPESAWNFINLAEGRQETEKEGPFYNGVLFHRVIDGFMIQAGCPEGTGMGGPGYEFANETHPELDYSAEGTLAMANRGRDTNGSQFFITLVPQVQLSPADYTVFGKVTQGMDVVKKIGAVKVDPRYNHRPFDDVVIQSVEIVR
ncbi:MAG: peptidyl-prolyl cis-trans isomerase [Halobacteriovoraceae bacterium]|nr:peptidyl-prolyl cis-trans isomerase [Halobacteriovoraceae bacterium]|tara:strand:+ start:13660 stop:14190 length:531 start_codon:yes stop_codon:yes gene_type:complete